MPRRKMGELLVERGLVTNEQMQEALEKKDEYGGRIGSALVRLGYIKEEAFLNFLSLYYDVPQVNIRNTTVDPKASKLIDPERARNWRVLPFRVMELPPSPSILFLATPDPTNFDAIEQVRIFTGYIVETFVCTFDGFCQAFDGAYGKPTPDAELDRILEGVETQLALKALTKILLKNKLIDATELEDILKKDNSRTGE